MTSRTRWLIVLGLGLCVCAQPLPAFAGMGSFTLSDVPRALSLSNMTRMRLEVISFFLLCLLLSAGLVQVSWNTLRKEVAILPRLSYGKSLGMIFLWGLLFVLVLTMISGARELMTPGAWEKKGLTYQLAGDPPPPIEQAIAERVETLTRLGEALNTYARDHGKRYPASMENAIPDALWVVPQSGGKRYRYVGGRLPDDEDYLPRMPLAYEPDGFGSDRLVLVRGGGVVWLPISEIEERIKGREDR